MRPSWFARIGFVFVPKHLVGWIALGGFITLAVLDFVRIDRDSHSVSDTLINFVFDAAILAVVYTLIASVFSRSSAVKETK